MQNLIVFRIAARVVIFAIISIFLRTAPAFAQMESQTTPGALVVGSLYLVKATGNAGPLTIEGVLPGTGQWTKAGKSQYTVVTGDGGPLTVVSTRPPSRPSPGLLEVKLYELSSTTTSLGSPLETLPVPVIGTLVTSKLTTKRSALYIISVAGEGQVGYGPGGVGRPGDAEYMDYQPDGQGNTDIGDRGVDYGVGVDDINVNVAPRAHKWGVWRADHTYFMVFEGTGKPVQFVYYDSNYLDNSPTDALTVNIYVAP